MVSTASGSAFPTKLFSDELDAMINILHFVEINGQMKGVLNNEQV